MPIMPFAMATALALSAYATSATAVDGSLSDAVLVAYAANDADSAAIATYYANQRAIPSTNLCPVTLPDPTLAYLASTDYSNAIKAPIRDCLSRVGRDKILYIVLAYMRPYRVMATSGKQYALDSYLADIWDQYSTADFDDAPQASHPYYADVQSQGNVYAPFVPLSIFRMRQGVPLIYSVWRLDGATPETARGLIDRAIAGSSDTLSGSGYIDRLGPVSDSVDAGLGQGEWDLKRAAELIARAGYTTIEDENPEEFGTSPAALMCPNAVFYAGWYSYDNYNDVFSWNPGAIGFHLDSASAADPRGGANWAANALRRGITVTAGAVSEPYLEGLPRPAGLFRNLLEGANVGDAFLRNTRWLKWMIVNIGDPLYRPFPTGAPGFNPPQAVDSFALSTREVSGGPTITATITLASPAPPNGSAFTVTTSAPDVISVPGNVTIPGGSTSVSFAVSTSIVATSIDCTISAVGPVSLANAITINPPQAPRGAPRWE